MAEFMANINRGASGAGAGGAGAGGAGTGGVGAGGAGADGAGPAAPEITGCTYVTFMKCDPQPFKGTEERDKVKFATATLQGRALTWWNGRIASIGIDAANGTLWTEVRKWMTEEFYPRSVLQRLEQELMVEPEQVKVEQYIRGLSKNIRGDVTSSRPTDEISMEKCNNEDIKDEDVEIEVDDDAELIFPYEVEYQPILYIRFCNHLILSSVREVDFTEATRVISARDLSYVGGLVPWALRHDLETSCVRARHTEAELGTCQTEIALLKSKNKIGEKERELLDHDLGDIMRKKYYLRHVCARFIIEQVVPQLVLELVVQEPIEFERWSREPVVPEPAAPGNYWFILLTFMKCDPQPFKGTEGAVGLCQWFEKLESVFRISDCKERDKVKFATATLQGHALTWWNGRIGFPSGIDSC
ncbi:hypothetical protein Tco_0881694 [Tanacetum coccineum]